MLPAGGDVIERGGRKAAPGAVFPSFSSRGAPFYAALAGRGTPSTRDDVTGAEQVAPPPRPLRALT